MKECIEVFIIAAYTQMRNSFIDIENEINQELKKIKNQMLKKTVLLTVLILVAIAMIGIASWQISLVGGVKTPISIGLIIGIVLLGALSILFIFIIRDEIVMYLSRKHTVQEQLREQQKLIWDTYQNRIKDLWK